VGVVEAGGGPVSEVESLRAFVEEVEADLAHSKATRGHPVTRFTADDVVAALRQAVDTIDRQEVFASVGRAVAAVAALSPQRFEAARLLRQLMHMGTAESYAYADRLAAALENGADDE
jgi:hypothetical protein